MYLFVRIFERIFYCLYFGFCFAGIGVLGHQTIFYLRKSAWKPLSVTVIDGLLHLNRKSPPDWLLDPQDWIGLHNLLDRTPLSLALFLLGLVCVVPAAAIEAKLGELKRHREMLKDESLTKQQQE